MSGQNIELSLSESFAKHKRNLLFVSAIVAILAVASPDQVKIPGVGDSQVPGPAAYFLLGAALLYFFWSYWVELLAVEARNSEITADSTGAGVAAKLNAFVTSLKAEVSAVTEFHAQVKPLMSSNGDDDIEILRSKLRSNIDNMDKQINILRSIGDDYEKLKSKEGYSLFDHIGQIKDAMSVGIQLYLKDSKSIKDKWSKIDKIHNKIFNKIEDIEVRTINFSKRIEIISSRISRSQRVGFTALEKYIPIALSVTAFLICLDGAFNCERVADILRNQVPVLADNQRSPANAVPKQGPTSTDNR
ncbi:MULTISPECIES: hypothetical protein [unclassified Sphingopyxis]|uniref:hypothetical protein n=1 Tax=unclassified Sphingopyxis TaxID=2614943 RepID=UPI002856C4A1|nr:MULTISPECIES: hypothetical protein [unclassified Sphingopyxis]MDR7061162.1 hypothetical protein [Sphingopyxis sp. BE235]MDR7181619.1 hypothetical protein [Sphingopyxis sp. BE249]